MSAETSPKVLISYSHDSKDYAHKILDLSNQLRNDGIDVTIDQYYPNPPEGWPLWMERQVEQSDFVLMAFTERYFRRCRGEEEAGVGRGVAWESTLIAIELYNSPHFNTKYIPVVLDAADLKWVLPRMQGFTSYILDCLDLNRESGYQNLYRHLTRQPLNPIPAKGDLRILRPQVVQPKTIVNTPDQPEPAIPMSQSELKKRLSNLLETIFEDIVFDMGANATIPGRATAQLTRANDLIRFAEATNQLEKLISLYLKATGNSR